MLFDQDYRNRRSTGPTNVALPSLPGILAVMALTPQLGVHLQGIAQTLLVEDFPGSTLTRGEREIIAARVSMENECLFCADSHRAFAEELLTREGLTDAPKMLDGVFMYDPDAISLKLGMLIAIASEIRAWAPDLSKDMIDAARSNGASEGDIQLTICIASAFCMFNKMVDGTRATTPASLEAHRAIARVIADNGYGKSPPLPSDLTQDQLFRVIKGSIKDKPDFENFCAKNFPALRSAMEVWELDHSIGSMIDNYSQAQIIEALRDYAPISFSAALRTVFP